MFEDFSAYQDFVRNIAPRMHSADVKSTPSAVTMRLQHREGPIDPDINFINSNILSAPEQQQRDVSDTRLIAAAITIIITELYCHHLLFLT